MVLCMVSSAWDIESIPGKAMVIPQFQQTSGGGCV